MVATCVLILCVFRRHGAGPCDALPSLYEIVSVEKVFCISHNSLNYPVFGTHRVCNWELSVHLSAST